MGLRFLFVLYIALFSSPVFAFSQDILDLCQKEQKGILLGKDSSLQEQERLKLEEHVVLVVDVQKENFFLFDEQQILVAEWQELPSADQIICLFLKHCQLHRQLKGMTGCLDDQPLKALYQTAIELKDEQAKNFILQQGLKTRVRPFFLLEQYIACMQKEGAFSLKTKKQKEVILEELQGEESLYTLSLLEFQELSKIEKLSLETLVAPLKFFLEKFPNGTKDHLWRMQMMLAEVYVSFDQWNFADEFARKAYANAPEHLLEEINRSLLFIGQNQLEKKTLTDQGKLHS